MIKLVDVSKYYRSNHSVALGLHKINLEFHMGEFVAITGESGSGKSTLLNVISGSDSYEDGELYFCGKETSYYDEADWEQYRKENIGFIYQSYKLIDSFTVLDNVKLAMDIINPDITEEEADAGASKYLAKVGLEALKKKRASQLSSGQKQRLAIARALAKETDIIVADEPTGNLDVENSRQLIQILSELSKEKLVLIVTHNYDEVASYVTRKIRMYEGEIAEDYVLRDNQIPKKEDVKENIEAPAKALTDKELCRKKKKETWVLAKKTTFKMWRSKPYSVLFLMIFYIFVFAAIFIFYGSFDKSIDYSTAKDFNDTTYINGVENRISIKKEDGSAITDEDVEYLQTISCVDYVDKYDVLNDISYFLYQDDDYVMEYRSNTYGAKQMPIKSTARAVEDNKFLKSVSALNEQKITTGEMPDALDEIVITSNDTSIVGERMTVYIRRKNNWGGYMACKEFTIVGLTNQGETHQIYVSEELAQNLSAVAMPPEEYRFYGIYARKGYGLAEETAYDVGDMLKDEVIKEAVYDGIFYKGDFGAIGETSLGAGSLVEEATIKSMEKLELIAPIFLVSPELKDFQVKLSENYYADAIGGGQQAIARTSYLYYGAKYKCQYYVCEVVWENSKNGNTVLEVSRELFDELYPDQNSYQTSVYVKDYAYLDRVMRKLEKEGYEAVSVMRVGSTDYNVEKVNEHTTRMLISLVALVVVFGIGILEIKTIMATRNDDYQIMQLLGLGRAVVDKINMLDITSNMIVAALGTIIIANVTKWMEIPYIASAVRYYEINDYVIYIIIIAVMMYLLHKSIRKVKRKNLYKEK